MRRLMAVIAGVAASVALIVAMTALQAGATWANVRATIAGTTQERTTIAESRFEVEIIVSGRPLPEYYARGRRYVEALEGAEYEVRVRNPLGVRVAVALSVDGLNTIDARRASAQDSSKWVIEPYQTITVSGWQMSSERARRFYFTTERNSYGAKLGQTSNLGNISAVFFRERNRGVVVTPPRRPYPIESDGTERNESRQKAPNTSAGRDDGSAGTQARRAEVYPAPDDDYAATGIGRSVRHDVTWINLDLESRPAAAVTVRYEYYDALVRLGIVPRSYPRPDPLRRRERATGFEEGRYSPEP